jgi:RNA polymerase sigma-70 factor (ECF subfamily)
MATEPIEELVERQLSERMSKALASLSLEQRQVLILADVEEYSYQEIADIVGCSIGTVRSRLHRARHQLRRQIESQTTSSS